MVIFLLIIILIFVIAIYLGIDIFFIPVIIPLLVYFYKGGKK